MKTTVKDILDIVNNKTLTTNQKHHFLANVAERMIPLQESMNFTDEEVMYMEQKMYYDDLNEGNVPYRPRYILPDYSLLMKKGVEFLGIKPPKNLDEAIDALLIMYQNVPSITSYPVYIGQLDELLEPFVQGTEEEYVKIDRFLNHIDKTIPDSFCHANIGPRDTKVGRMIIRSCIEHPSPTPNLTMKYKSGVTPQDFIAYSLKASLVSAKPAFSNDDIYAKENKGEYGIASCYNILPIAGGGSTLPRLKLLAPAKDAKNIKDFMDNYLPKSVDIMLSILMKRHDYIMNTIFWEVDYLVRENFIKKENFLPMFGLIGLGSAVNHLMSLEGKNLKMGHDEEANELGDKIMAYMDKRVEEYNSKHKTNIQLHAQVGANLQEIDNGLSLATRVPVGTEPELFDHLKHIGQYQAYCKAGCGEHFSFDPIWEKRTDKLAGILESAFKLPGTRYIGVYGQESDFVRVTGYLVRRSEIEKLRNGEAVLRDTDAMGQGTDDSAQALTRKKRPMDKVVLNRDDLFK